MSDDQDQRFAMKFWGFIPYNFGILYRKPIFATPMTNREGGAVAQSVEQRTENPCVGGSIPPHTTVKMKRLQRKIVAAFSFGSNNYGDTLKFPCVRLIINPNAGS
jgi:hypothetical protein